MYRKSIKMMSRILLTSVLLLGICLAGQAKKQLIVIGHQVHRKAATAEETGALGRNLIEEFEKKYDERSFIKPTLTLKLKKNSIAWVL